MRPVILLAIGTAIAYYQVVNFEFVNFDDPIYVYENTEVQRGFDIDTVNWAFTEPGISGHYHPLTWISLALDMSLFGLKPGWFHLTNVLLHLGSAVMLYLVLKRSTGSTWRSFAVAALFAWHPLHVESVAWITERKDVLSTYFWMATMLIYLEYVRRPTLKHYLEMAACFALGLLSKSMVVTLPCVLLLWDIWPLRRQGWRRLILEKVPLLLMSLLCGNWTFIVMTPAETSDLEILTVPERIATSVLSSVTYLGEMVWPMNLAPWYPARSQGLPVAPVLMAGLLLLAITLVAMLSARRHPYVLVGWLWYLGTLLPVSLRLQRGGFVWADRYTYVPLIGVFIVLVWGVSDVAERVRSRWRQPALASLLTAALLGCIYCTWHQVKIWENSETLWTHTLAVTHDNFLANVNLAKHYEVQGRFADAEAHYLEAIRSHPRSVPGQLMLGRFYSAQQRDAEAVEPLRRAVELSPGNARAKMMLAEALRKLGRDREAEELWP